jgi:hypothetical protein
LHWLLNKPGRREALRLLLYVLLVFSFILIPSVPTYTRPQPNHEKLMIVDAIQEAPATAPVDSATVTALTTTTGTTSLLVIICGSSLWTFTYWVGLTVACVTEVTVTGTATLVTVTSISASASTTLTTVTAHPSTTLATVTQSPSTTLETVRVHPSTTLATVTASPSTTLATVRVHPSTTLATVTVHPSTTLATVTVHPSTTLRTVSVSATRTRTATVVTTLTRTATSSAFFGPLPLGGLSTLWTYIAYVVIFGGLGLDLAPGSKLRLSRKWVVGASSKPNLTQGS